MTAVLDWRVGARTALPVALATAALATAALAAGCGSSSPTAAASSGSAATSGYERGVRFSACMRSHGVPGFPDPSKSANGQPALIIHAGPGQFDPASPAFQSAQQACAKFNPKGGPGSAGVMPANAKAQALRFSACMRSHGVPGFPDPVFSGNSAGLRLSLGSGVNPASPAFKAAQRACGSPFPGGIVSSDRAK